MAIYVNIITDTDIRLRFDEAVSKLERDNQIRFPDSKAREDFIEDCVRSKIDKFELYDSDPFNRQINYAVEVLDVAELYGYQI